MTDNTEHDTPWACSSVGDSEPLFVRGDLTVIVLRMRPPSAGRDRYNGRVLVTQPIVVTAFKPDRNQKGTS